MQSSEHNVTIIRCCEPEPEPRSRGVDPRLTEFVTIVIRLAATVLSSIGAMHLLGWI